MSVFAQSLPAMHKVSRIGGGLTKRIPSGGLEALVAKLEIPYLEDLRQVKGLKKSYDSLQAEVKKLNEVVQDSTTQDSVMSVLKEKGQEVLDREKAVLTGLLEEQDIPGEELKAAAQRTLEGVERAKPELDRVLDPDGLDGILN
ncbi:hypothetical protein [Algoriphagus boritolerans]|uniref:hypothetical protein n=1 Tax=Algoriphagus boritolerans TaxID=308111 RepID=UPI002FCE43C1